MFKNIIKNIKNSILLFALEHLAELILNYVEETRINKHLEKNAKKHKFDDFHKIPDERTNNDNFLKNLFK